MAFEWKDIITPAATLTAVWLGANFTLRNEIRKKSLEIQSQKLEQLALECEQLLMNLIRYTLAVRSILHDLSNGLEDGVTQARYAAVIAGYKDSGITIDFDKVIACQNRLEFHRPVEYELWMKTVRPLITQLNETVSWQSHNPQVSAPEKEWEAQKVRDYYLALDNKMESLTTLRKQLVRSLSEDFKAITHTENLNLWTLLWAGKKSIKRFFRKPPVSPS